MDMLPECEGDWTKNWEPSHHGQFFWGLGSCCMCQEGFKGLAWDTQLLNIIIKTQLKKWKSNQPKENTQVLCPAEPKSRTHQCILFKLTAAWWYWWTVGTLCVLGDLSIHSSSWGHIDLRQEAMGLPSYSGAKSWGNWCFLSLPHLVRAEDWQWPKLS